MRSIHSSLRSVIIGISAVVILAACSACNSTPSAPAAQSTQTSNAAANGNKVLITQFKYQPETLTIKLGETVEWTNQDSVPHTATASDGKSFDSGSLANGASWRFTPTQKGTFQYICTFHPNMKATLIVQ